MKNSSCPENIIGSNPTVSRRFPLDKPKENKSNKASLNAMVQLADWNENPPQEPLPTAI